MAVNITKTNVRIRNQSVNSHTGHNAHFITEKKVLIPYKFQTTSTIFKLNIKIKYS